MARRATQSRMCCRPWCWPWSCSPSFLGLVSSLLLPPKCLDPMFPKDFFAAMGAVLVRNLCQFGSCGPIARSFRTHKLGQRSPPLPFHWPTCTCLFDGHYEKPLRQQERKLAMACGILGLCKLLKLSQHSFCFQLPVGRMHSIRVGWVADLPFAPECAHSAICATSLWGSSSDPGERPTGVFFITVHIISKDHIYKRINEKSNIAEQTFVCHVFGAILGR